MLCLQSLLVGFRFLSYAPGPVGISSDNRNALVGDFFIYVLIVVLLRISLGQMYLLVQKEGSVEHLRLRGENRTRNRMECNFRLRRQQIDLMTCETAGDCKESTDIQIIRFFFCCFCFCCCFSLQKCIRRMTEEKWDYCSTIPIVFPRGDATESDGILSVEKWSSAFFLRLLHPHPTAAAA